MNRAKYSHEKYLEYLEVKGIPETELPEKIQNLLGKLRNEIANTTHTGGKQIPAFIEASDKLKDILEEWYEEMHSEPIDQVPAKSCGCKNDKILASHWNAGHRKVYKTELKKQGYSCNMWGNPSVCKTKNFELKPTNIKGQYILKKI